MGSLVPSCTVYEGYAGRRGLTKANDWPVGSTSCPIVPGLKPVHGILLHQYQSITLSVPIGRLKLQSATKFALPNASMGLASKSMRMIASKRYKLHKEVKLAYRRSQTKAEVPAGSLDLDFGITGALHTSYMTSVGA